MKTFFLLALIALSGCVSVPDTWNYTLSVDHQTGQTTSYVGVSGPINWHPSRTK